VGSVIYSFAAIMKACIIFEVSRYCHRYWWWVIPSRVCLKDACWFRLKLYCVS